MKYIIAVFFTALVVWGPSAFASEEQLHQALRIVEVQTHTADSAGEEFVEIANIGVAPLDLEEVELQYKSKDGTNWSTKATLEGWAAPYGRVLIHTHVDEAGIVFNGGLAGGSGHLRLAIADETIDLVAWGEASSPDAAAAVAHGPGESLKRFVGEDGYFIDTDNNYDDWFTSQSPSPKLDVWDVAEVESIVEGDTDSADTITEETIVAKDPAEPTDSNLDIQKEETVSPELPSAVLHITELLPDPVSPLKDALHEFVEIYNPNSFAVQLNGYTLESGADGRYSHTLGEYLLTPGEYLSVYSEVSGLTLSNSGSRVAIFGPDGVSHDEVEYPKAKAGRSWSLGVDGWGWSSPTTNKENSLPIASVVVATIDSGTKVEKKDVDYADATGSESNTNPAASTFVPDEQKTQQANNWVLAGVGVLAVLYAVYEYRNDIRLRVQQCRRYFEIRRENRSES